MLTFAATVITPATGIAIVYASIAVYVLLAVINTFAEVRIPEKLRLDIFRGLL